jgi:hypothetical protein
MLANARRGAGSDTFDVGFFGADADTCGKVVWLDLDELGLDVAAGFNR